VPWGLCHVNTFYELALTCRVFTAEKVSRAFLMRLNEECF
jgi:hypothetical protein